jgi:hypothetical protein
LSKVKYIAAISGAAFVVWGAFFLRQAPPKSAPLSIQERMGDVNWDERAMIVKGPRLIPTVKVTPDPPAAVPVVEIKEEQVEPVVKSYQRRERSTRRDRSNVCRVHGMRKVYVSKYRWRCRR